MRAVALLLALSACGSPLYAVPNGPPSLSPESSGKPTFVPSEDPNVIGHIVLHNRHNYEGANLSFFVIVTPVGEVLVEWNQTQNDECPISERPCADTLEVFELPSGYAAIPLRVEVDEGSHGIIQIVPILGF